MRIEGDVLNWMMEMRGTIFAGIEGAESLARGSGSDGMEANRQRNPNFLLGRFYR